MLSFKDIKIIEDTLDTPFQRDSGAREEKILASLLSLMSSRFQWELTQKGHFFEGILSEKNIKIQIGLAQNISQVKDDSYLRLNNNLFNFYLQQKSLISFADMMWREEKGRCKREELFPSDIFMAKEFGKFLGKSLCKATKPLIKIDDYRINNSYKSSIELLSERGISFQIQILFDYFKFYILGTSSIDLSNMVIFEENPHFDAILVSE